MTRPCLVLGSAQCLWDDVSAALDLGEYEAVYAAKHAGIYWPGRLDVWITFHPEWAVSFREQRRFLRYPEPGEVVAHEQRPGVDRVVRSYLIPGMHNSGASGFFAVQQALEAGYDRLVLCGIPMTREHGRIDGRKIWDSAVTYQTRVRPILGQIRDRVRSMSGWTQRELGAPTTEWLTGHELAQDAPHLGEMMNA